MSSCPDQYKLAYRNSDSLFGHGRMAWPEPLYSKNAVRKAGKNIVRRYREPTITKTIIPILAREDLIVVENWRAAHGAVLNGTQAWLRGLEKQNRPVIGQRLKRLNTIIDKLATERSKDLSTMNDIAGVRAIFRSESDLHDFRKKMRGSRAKHKLTHDEAKFDYITDPKDTGYRGIHEVYTRHVQAPNSTPWNSLRFEVQLRTAVQHAWATAVEIYDSTSRGRFKFEKSDTKEYRQFLIISELFARIHENKTSCLATFSDDSLVSEFKELEATTKMVATIRNLKVADTHDKLTKNTILIRKNDGNLYMRRYRTFQKAMLDLVDIENHVDTSNAVLVGSTTPAHTRDAFRNYFDDTKEFTELLDSAVQQITTTGK